MGKRGYLRKCMKCNMYTLKDKCPVCSFPTKNPHPARFSIEDKFGAYRRKLLLEISFKEDC